MLFNVTLDLASPNAENDVRPTETELQILGEAIAKSVSADIDELECDYTVGWARYKLPVEVDDGPTALADAITAVTNAATDAISQLPMEITESPDRTAPLDWDAVRITALDVEAKELEDATIPDPDGFGDPRAVEIVGVAEAAEIIGVGRGRLSTLDMPSPIVTLKAGKIWLQSDIVEFAKKFNSR